MNTKVDEKLRNEYIVSFKNDDMIVDTIIFNNKTVFTMFDRKTNKIEKKDFFILGKIKYIPLRNNSNLIRTWTLLLPSDYISYGNKEELIKDIQDYIYEYVDIPDEYRIICSYYVLLTYLYENFSEVPYLRVLGDYGSWKSRLLKVISYICYNAIMTTWGTSLSALFRTINNVKWTLMLDEADFWYSWTQAEIIKLLNNGYQKWFPLMRSDWERFDVNTYEVFGPKIIWWRYEFQDKATESRCLINIMQKSNRLDIPTWLNAYFEDRAMKLKNKLLKFRYDYFDKVKVKSEIIHWVEPRLSQIINPILSLVDNKIIEKIIIDSIICKQDEIKEDKKNSIFWAILAYLRSDFKWRDVLAYQDIINQLDKTDGKHNITHRKLWCIFKQNKLKSIRRNYGTILPFRENMDVLTKLYEEYWIV